MRSIGEVVLRETDVSVLASSICPEEVEMMVYRAGPVWPSDLGCRREEAGQLEMQAPCSPVTVC